MVRLDHHDESPLTYSELRSALEEALAKAECGLYTTWNFLADKAGNIKPKSRLVEKSFLELIGYCTHIADVLAELCRMQLDKEIFFRPAPGPREEEADSPVAELQDLLVETRNHFDHMIGASYICLKRLNSIGVQAKGNKPKLVLDVMVAYQESLEWIRDGVRMSLIHVQALPNEL